jgi:hypothetical protein
MQIPTKSLARLTSLAAALSLALSIGIGALPASLVSATTTQLTTRSLTVSSSANGGISSDISGLGVSAGAGGNGTKTAETITFTLGQASNVGSIDFLYCTTPLPGTTCTAPTGLDASHVASIQSQSGWSTNNLTFGSATTSEVKLSRGAGAAETTAGAKTIVLGGQTADYITNPTTDNTTFFIRITVYSDTAYTTTVDQGTVASSTALQVDITAKVQETLALSVGTFTGGSGVPTAPSTNCTPLAGTTGMTLGDVNGVLSATTAYTAHSYFRVSTNATHGLVVEYSGNTLTSGSNTIAAIGTTAASSATGTPQFGIGIDTTDTQSGSGYSFTYLATAATYANINTAGGVPTNATNKWAFSAASAATPVTIASSTGIVVCDTGSVSYLANIAYATSAGIYITNITYIAVPTY